MSITEILDPNWYADTRATAHMKNDPGILYPISSYDGEDKIYFGDGKSLSISHPGSVSLSSQPSKLHSTMC